MSKVTFQQSISLDGFSAGPHQNYDHPLGLGGEELHHWVIPLEAWRKPHGLEGGWVNASNRVMEEAAAHVGAVVMGRNMFGGGPGPWPEEPWRGWWGDDPPFHAPVFVLTHYDREPLPMAGGTTFHFVTDGFDQAFAQARAASAGAGVSIAGGANTIQQALRAGVVDEFWVHVVPVILGGGVRLFDNVSDLRLQQVESIAGDGVVHTKYRVVK
jgi:dihydrofolate reductase